VFYIFPFSGENEKNITKPTQVLSIICKPPRKVYQYNKANTEELKEKLRNIDIEKQLKEQDLNVDKLWNNFKEKVLNIMNQSIPTKMINNSKRKLPWSLSTFKSCSFNCFSMSMFLSFSFNSSVFALLYWYTFLGGLFTFLGLILALHINDNT
jgi:hypothetical protein